MQVRFSLRDNCLAEEGYCFPGPLIVDYFPNDGWQRKVMSDNIDQDTTLVRPCWTYFQRMLRRVLVTVLAVRALICGLSFGLLVQITVEAAMSQQHFFFK